MPEGVEDTALTERLDALYASVGSQIECGLFKDALEEIFAFIRGANKYFDTKQPWITRSTDKSNCDNTLYQCVQIIANLAVLLAPFVPFSSKKVLTWLNLSDRWERKAVAAGFSLPEIEILFQRIDKEAIEIETNKLKLL